ncbi:outer membrane protein, cobalt-zinc-cadmium efflux system [Methylobacillus rhizosphaerae]|uniref:Outer membrane protein, cobalt-zinc-cadmium efflux system n=1 Tax=Methylobacillus rhizosphaerae TaxID=551994 RepID=A0A238ZYC7_9PROT|nr:TolC family protein [Methylobacillus rhizosphaerae]SNR88132.1 outer membrane protein, cobalt-zinc-cadmium efflux system [Methylobacillus rhizosphaerae]
MKTNIDVEMHKQGTLLVQQERPRALMVRMLSVVLACWIATPALAAYTLPEMIDTAMQHNPVLGIATAQRDVAEAAVTTASTYSNPQVEALMGPSRYLTPGGQGDHRNWNVGLSQALDFPWVRNAKIEAAESGTKVADAGMDLVRIELRSRVKNAFYDVLQRKAVLKLVEGDRNLLQQIRERVKLRVDTGESPRYELIKADTEALAAERDYQTALVRVTEGKAYLRGLVGAGVPLDYEVEGELPMVYGLPSLEQLREQIVQSPQLSQLRAVTETAEAKLKLEERLRNPGLTLKASVEEDPDLRQLRFGVAIPLPLWDRRQGPIAAAGAEVRQSQATLHERELGLRRDMEAAYQRYMIAQQQLSAFENGLLSQAESVLKVAEAAYRYGERGILEYMDAQRTFRMVRKDYFAAKFDYVSSMLEIERLLGTELLEVKP